MPFQSDPVDVAVALFVNNWPGPLKIPFVRESQGSYKFGFKRVSVDLKNGMLVIRIGGGCMLIGEFVEIYTQRQLEKILYKNRGFSLGNLERGK